MLFTWKIDARNLKNTQEKQGKKGAPATAQFPKNGSLDPFSSDVQAGN
jgi:hypothetical protein